MSFESTRFESNLSGVLNLFNLLQRGSGHFWSNTKKDISAKILYKFQENYGYRGIWELIQFATM